MLKLENLILLTDTVPVSWSEITNGPKVAKNPIVPATADHHTTAMGWQR
jgi:hypothetical protein